jgi:hypothetical protein
MTTASQKLALVHAHVVSARGKRPAVPVGQKYALIDSIVAEDGARAEIRAHLEECEINDECIAELNQQNKDSARACFEKFALNPKLFNKLRKHRHADVTEDIEETQRAVLAFFGE